MKPREKRPNNPKLKNFQKISEVAVKFVESVEIYKKIICSAFISIT